MAGEAPVKRPFPAPGLAPYSLRWRSLPRNRKTRPNRRAPRRRGRSSRRRRTRSPICSIRRSTKAPRGWAPAPAKATCSRRRTIRSTAAPIFPPRTRRANRRQTGFRGGAAARLCGLADHRARSGVGEGTGAGRRRNRLCSAKKGRSQIPPAARRSADQHRRRRQRFRRAWPASSRWINCCARAAPNSATKRRAAKSGCRTGRRARKNPKAASAWSSNPSSSRRATSPNAISELVEGVKRHDRTQVLLGVTGSGKTFTMAKVIEATQRPALILAPNKTLAAQLYGEFKSFFPDNAVEYFVSYYDYYQPEAYVPRTDTYIEKESSINEQIDRMRHSATRALLERDDVVIVASVSCIYGIGSVETYSAMTFTLKQGGKTDQRQLLADLVALQYKRTQADFYRGSFRVRGDTVDIFPAHYEDRAWRVHLFGDEIEKIEEMRPAHRAKDRRAGIRQDLRQLALRHAAPDADPGDLRHQERTQRPPRPAQRRRPPAGSAAPRTAHGVRPGNDGSHRLLRRHRELFALSHRPQAGRAAADFVRIRAGQRAGLRRREPRLHPAARRHVPRRLPPQGDARRIRLPPALLHGQPPADASRNGTPCGRRPWRSPPRPATGR